MNKVENIHPLAESVSIM